MVLPSLFLFSAWLCVLCASAVFLVAPAVSADEPDPFEALRDGRVRLSPPASRLRAGIPGHEVVRVADDGGFVLPAVPLGVPVRAYGLVADGGGDLYHAPRLFATEPRVLEREGGAEPLELLGPGKGVPTLYGLQAAAPDGAPILALGTQESVQLLLLAAADEGPVDVLASEWAPHAVGLASTDPRVATVSPGGVVTAREPGIATIQMVTANETTQLVVRVDGGTDRDGDGLPDSWEVGYGLDPDDPTDAMVDPDQDGLTNLEEFRWHTHPELADTDGDLLGDGDEVHLYGTDPAIGDTDGDSVTDGPEIVRGLDPLDPNEHAERSFDPELKAQRSLAALAARAAVRSDDLIFVVSEDGVLSAFSVNLPLFFVVPLGAVDLRVESAVDLSVDGEWACVAIGAPNGGLATVDLRDPAAMRVAELIGGLGPVAAVAARSGRVYALTADELLTFVRGEDGALDAAGRVGLVGGGRMAVSEPLVFVGDPVANRLSIFDTADITRPRPRGALVLPEAAGGMNALTASGSFAYVAHGSAGVIAVSALDADAPEVIEPLTTASDGFAESVAVRGNRLVWSTRGEDRALLVRQIEDDGGIGPGPTEGRSIPISAGAVEQILFSQEYVVALHRESFSVSQVLPEGDRGGVPPRGQIIPRDARSVFLADEWISFTVRAADDVHMETVEILVDGRRIMSDSVPPFRFLWRPDDPDLDDAEVVFSAIGIDLAGNRGDLGRLAIRIDGDRDGDGIPDTLDRDSDGDGLADIEELYEGADGLTSDPERFDTDGDTIGDREEVRPGEDGFVTDPARADSDGDALPDGFEVFLSGTDPTRADGDGDGVSDAEEDPDGDGLVTLDELHIGTHPREADTDTDGLADGLEVRAGLDPRRVDSDGDAIPDGDEDTDRDGVANRRELAVGTALERPDTDGDSLDDGTELDLATDPREWTDFSGRALVVSDRTVTLYGPLAVGSLELIRSVLTVAPSGEGEPPPLELDIGDELRVGAASRIDVTARGYAGGGSEENPRERGAAPDGAAAPLPLGGGSHGGAGGGARGPAAERAADHELTVYGDVRYPRFAGGGGSTRAESGRAGRGGGVIIVRAARVFLDGELVANGEGAPIAVAGGGAGGSIRIECARIEGAGRMTADGASAMSVAQDRLAPLEGNPGAGGGGRIAVLCEEGFAFSGGVSARGGSLVDAAGDMLPDSATASRLAGGAGTIYIRESVEDGGVLIVDNGGRVQNEPRTVLRGAGEGTIADLGDDFLVREDGEFPPWVVGLELDVRAGNDHADVVTILAVDGPRIETTPGLLERTEVGATFRGVLRLAALAVGDAGAVESRVDLEVESLRVEAGELSAGGAMRAGGMEMRRSLLTVPSPRVDRYHALELTVSGQLTIDTESRVDATGKGYVGGLAGGNRSPRGVSADFHQSGVAAGSGGSHGGVGGAGETDPAPAVRSRTYDRFLRPERPGGGGAAGLPAGDSPDPQRGYNGGGLVTIRASTLALDGLIVADGDGPNDNGRVTCGGAGAGGGVFVSVGVLEGAGEIRANGGDSGRAAGAGGGGRVAVHAGDSALFAGRVYAYGGRSVPGASLRAVGGAGTVFWKRGSDPYGDLIVDNGGRTSSGLTTPQRAVGSGTIAGLSRRTLEAEADIAFPVSDTGLSGQAVILAGVLDSPFVIESNTANTLTAASSVQLNAVGGVGDAFQGALVLHSLRVSGAAAFSTAGDIILVIGGAFTRGPASVVDAGDVIFR